MATLTVEYIPDSRHARLTLSEGGAAWNDIRQACHDRSTEVQDIGPFSVSLPWWAFLYARSAISFYVGRHSLEVKFDAESRILLEKSKSRADVYKQAVASEPVSEDLIRVRLKEAGFERVLTDRQMRNVRKLVAMDSGATFSVPGAGKTTEALAFYFYKRSVDARLVIVCPKNAFAVWEEQIQECVKGFDKNGIVRLIGGEQNIHRLLENDPAVSLITYQQLPNVVSLVGQYLARHRCFMFVDESHKMKRGSGGVWASALLSVSHLAEYKLVLSGTPMPQSAYDLVAQFQFLFPEIQVDGDSVASLIKPVYVRTTKKELNIPQLDRYAIPIQLTSEQRYVYNLLRSEVARQADNTLSTNKRSQYRLLGRSAMRLLQFVSNPALLLSSGAIPESLLADVLASGDSPKIALACQRARELAAQGKKTMIWSSFVQNVELIAARLADLGADYIHGGVETGSEEEEQTRERKISRFHSDKRAFVLVGNPAACGESISLHTVCHHAIYVDRIFNVAQYLQSEDRIHRLGLSPDQSTTIELLVCPDTIDETVDVRLRAKVKRMGEVLEDPDLNIDPVSFDPEDEELDAGDVEALLKHLQERVH
jgi:SNF2 family DNA or RNA helicase